MGGVGQFEWDLRAHRMSIAERGKPDPVREQWDLSEFEDIEQQHETGCTLRSLVSIDLNMILRSRRYPSDAYVIEEPVSFVVPLFHTFLHLQLVLCLLLVFDLIADLLHERLQLLSGSTCGIRRR